MHFKFNLRSFLPNGHNLPTFVLICLVISTIWLLVREYYYREYYLFDAETAGQYGDMLGIVNSLFSGFTFAGLIYTILLQRHEIKEAKSDAHEQLRIAKTQQLETTLFNIIRLHNSLVDNLAQPHPLHETAEIRGRNIFFALRQELFDNGFNQHLTKDNFQELAERYRGIFKKYRITIVLTPYKLDRISVLVV